MTIESRYGDASVTVGENGVVEIEIHRPPNNYFDVGLIHSLSEAYEAIDADPTCRAIVLCAEGKHFCAGANFTSSGQNDNPGGLSLYSEAARIIEAKTPVVAAVHGAAIGGGLGLACSADFRVGSDDTRMSANFAQLGFHHGFGLTVLLPPLVGQQKALELLYTGKRIAGEEAYRIGLLDRFVGTEEVRAAAHQLAGEIAASAPLAVRSIRETMRAGLGERYRAATDRENAEQSRLRVTADWAEGVKATAERRPPRFIGA
jgi:enoyl-CoA hydratase/carnithine racemase